MPDTISWAEPLDLARERWRLGIECDCDREGNVVSIEILDASNRVENPRAVEFVAGAPG